MERKLDGHEAPGACRGGELEAELCEYFAGAELVRPWADPSAPVPLIEACDDGNIAAVRALMALGVDELERDECGETALHMCAQWGRTACAAALLARSARSAFELASAASDDGSTPVMEAVRGGHRSTLTLLLLAAPEAAHCQDEDGQTALHIAAWLGDAHAIERLLVAGARINTMTGSGDTPLHIAAFAGHAEAVQALLKGGADFRAPSMRRSGSRTALEHAVDQGHAEAADLLSEASTRAFETHGLFA